MVFLDMPYTEFDYPRRVGVYNLFIFSLLWKIGVLVKTMGRKLKREQPV